jgi:hypothetical protein
VCIWQLISGFLLSGLSAGLDRKGLSIYGPQTGPKLLEAWLFNKVMTNTASCTNIMPDVPSTKQKVPLNLFFI